jgi:hypothetical protein
MQRENGLDAGFEDKNFLGIRVLISNNKFGNQKNKNKKS